MMEFSAEMIASFLEGEIDGNKEVKVSSLAKIEEAKPGSLAFLSNPKYEHYIYSTEASIVIVNRSFVPARPVRATLIKVDDAYSCFAKLLELYVANKPRKTGVSPLASVHEGAVLGKDVYVGEYAVIEEGAQLGDGVQIYPYVYVGNRVRIAENAIVYPGACIYEECVIGRRVIIHSGAVIGADGFGFAPVNGTYKKIPQIGNTVLEDDVEIGANTCIDRATMGSTIIRKGVKLDNLIQIGHNVVIDENTVAAAQCGIAGSTKVGKNCMFAGQVGIAGHLTIAPYTQAASQSGIGSSVRKEGEVLLGTPAFNAIDSRRASVAFKSLPEMRQKLFALEKEVERLKQALEKEE